jgi:hypothetical protein
MFGLLMSLPTSKISSEKWKDGPYKVRIKKKQDYAGPPYFQYKVKKKIMGGLFYMRIHHNSISGKEYYDCTSDFYRKDTLTVDFCKKKVFKK